MNDPSGQPPPPGTSRVLGTSMGLVALVVGDVIPRFESVDAFGEPFDSGTLDDHLLLIRFFRTQW